MSHDYSVVARDVPTRDEHSGGPVTLQWTGTRVLVIALCFLMNMLDGTDLLVMSFIAPVLAEQWSVSPEQLGILFSASLAGMAAGCLLLAPLADKIGRRSMLVGALGLVAVSMLSSAFARNVMELMLARFCVGIGVGTIGVSMTAMAAEYAPPRYTNFAVGFVQAGWPFGSIITAFAAVGILPASGWRTLLIAVGAASVALFVLIYFLLPESLAFLTSRRPADALVKANKIRRRLKLTPLTDLPPVAAQISGSTVVALFKDGRAGASVLLWTAVTLGYFDLYFVISWIPRLVAQAGLPLADAIYAGATYNLGAFIGTTAVGWIALKYGLNKVIALFLGAAAVAMLIFGGIPMPVWLTLVVAAGIGVTVQGGFNGFWTLAARLYPATMRSTGIGWALGVGRVGAVLGPVVGGFLVGAKVPTSTIFAIYAVPLVLAALITLRVKITR